ATDYWITINKTMLTFSAKIQALWEIEKGVATESIAVAKAEALTFLAQEREKIMRMSHQEALRELLNVYKIESKMNIVTEISDNELFTLK
ncbi:MAG: HindIII family type II restriction endonuclease, partial [Thermoflexibacteraceae bacterium]